jgi:hypothetical protein
MRKSGTAHTHTPVLKLSYNDYTHEHLEMWKSRTAHTDTPLLKFHEHFLSIIVHCSRSGGKKGGCGATDRSTYLG